VFDIHTHVYPSSAGGFWRRPSSVEQLLAAMDDAGVARAAVIAIAGHISNAVVHDAAIACPDRLVAIGSVDPLAADAVTDVDAAVGRFGARGIKLHPRLQGLRFEHLDRIVPVARRCAHHRVPLVICTFLGGPDLYRGRTLELCHELAQNCPETAIVLAHAGGYRPLDALLILKANANVHVDVSFSSLYFRGSSVPQDVEHLIRRADPRRVLFGSDFPEASIAESVAFVRGAAARAQLAPSHVDAILHDNAVRLLGLGA
jgi:predicted TIM-barrel fold metal-dependent hydrolase